MNFMTRFLRRISMLFSRKQFAGELDEDVVGLIDDVVVGDDVAARIDDEAGAEGLTLAELGRLTAVAPTAEEAVEEVLHVVVVAAAAVIVAIRLIGVGQVATAATFGSLGDVVGVDVDDGGTDLLDDGGEAVGEDDRAGEGQGTGVGGVDALRFLAADLAGDDGAEQNARGENGEQSKGCRETTAAQALDKTTESAP